MLTLLAAIFVILVAPVGALWFFGSRTPVDTTIRFEPAAIGPDPAAYLGRSEAAVADIRPGLSKEIVWFDPQARARTKVAIVYIHGFSASPAETRPLPDIVSRNLGANLFLTRLSGHGASREAMGRFTVADLVDDFAEAIAIGERLGESVVVLACSSGAALATWSLGRPEFANRIAAAVFMSPNYGVLAFGSSLLTKPGARELARLLIGPTRSFEPANELNAAYWTNEYPVEALLPMAEVVKLAVSSPVERIEVPALFLISAADSVVDPRITRRIAARWGGAAQLDEVSGVEDPSQHVLAGDAMSPSTTAPVAATITEWLRRTLVLAG